MVDEKAKILVLFIQICSNYAYILLNSINGVKLILVMLYMIKKIYKTMNVYKVKKMIN